jgi:hypothetical protein
MSYPTVPDGYRRLDAQEVWTDGSDLVVLGQPPDGEESGHDCDEMGCAQCHVLARTEHAYLGVAFAALAAEEGKRG